jgi:hypothetical protein
MPSSESCLELTKALIIHYDERWRRRPPFPPEVSVQRIREGLKANIRSLVNRQSGLDEIAVDDLATSTKLQSWEAVQIPERLRFSSRLAIKLVALFILIVASFPGPKRSRSPANSPPIRPSSARRTSKLKLPDALRNGISSKACG